MEVVKESPIKEHFIHRNVQVHNITENKIIHSFYTKDIFQIRKVDDKTVAAIFLYRVELWGITEHQSNFERTVTKTYYIDKICLDIDYRVGNLFLNCIYDPDQYTIKQLNNIGYEVTSFIFPFHHRKHPEKKMTVSPDGKTIYVSSSGQDSIESYTPEGQIMARYRNESLFIPSKMMVDSKGNLFVIGSLPGSNNIFYISPDLTHGYELIQTDVYPDSITYNEIDNSLYFSSIDERSIIAFKIKI
jgi:hypothetical protein